MEDLTFTLSEEHQSKIDRLKENGVVLDIPNVLDMALNHELDKCLAPIIRAERETQRVKTNAERLLDPKPGDIWGSAPAGTNNVYVFKRIGEDELIIWMDEFVKKGVENGTLEERGFRRITRNWLSGRVYHHKNQEAPITDLDSKYWSLNCFVECGDAGIYNEFLDHVARLNLDDVKKVNYELNL